MAAVDATITKILDSTQTRKHMPVDARPSPMKVSYVCLPRMWPYLNTQTPV